MSKPLILLILLSLFPIITTFSDDFTLKMHCSAKLKWDGKVILSNPNRNESCRFTLEYRNNLTWPIAGIPFEWDTMTLVHNCVEHPKSGYLKFQDQPKTEYNYFMTNKGYPTEDL